MDKEINKIIFPEIENYEYLKFDDIGLYSISKPEEANQITNIIKNYKNNIKTIVDATAGIGGNTISFSKNFSKVYSIEMDKNRFNILENNINIFNLNNVKLINGNCINYLDKIEADVWFFDPPWGGPEYKLSKKINIRIGSLSIKEIINKLNNKLVVFKLPYNFNLDLIIDFDYTIYKIKNYLLILFNPVIE